MFDLKDATFLLPVKVESEDRARNLKIVVDFLNNHLDTNILICEQGSDSVRQLLEGYKFEYMRLDVENNGLIHRTKQLNDMIKKSKTKIVVNCDVDVLVYPNIYKEAYDLVKDDKFDVVIPYLGPCYDVPIAYHENILTQKKLDHIEPIKEKCGLMNGNSIGGILFYDKEKYISGGMENENFVSWGFEDNERLYRFKTLGYRITRVGGNLFHLHHTRTSNSHHTHSEYNTNQREYLRISRMNKEQLEHEVSKWRWCK
jgi:hypothetical protein